jgi:hypothetical protein
MVDSSGLSWTLGTTAAGTSLPFKPRSAKDGCHPTQALIGATLDDC